MFILKYILIFMVGSYNPCYDSLIYDLDFWSLVGSQFWLPWVLQIQLNILYLMNMCKNIEHVVSIIQLFEVTVLSLFLNTMRFLTSLNMYSFFLLL